MKLTAVNSAAERAGDPRIRYGRWLTPKARATRPGEVERSGHSITSRFRTDMAASVRSILNNALLIAERQSVRIPIAYDNHLYSLSVHIA